MDLKRALEIIIFSNEDNIQLDIFRKNGQVLSQLYKQRDVKKWDYDILMAKDNGLILELNFNKAKTDNKNNYLRFKESSYHNKFKQFEKVKENSYFLGIEIDQPIENIEFLINDIISTVYLIGYNEYYFTVKAY